MSYLRQPPRDRIPVTFCIRCTEFLYVVSRIKRRLPGLAGRAFPFPVRPCPALDTADVRAVAAIVVFARYYLCECRVRAVPAVEFGVDTGDLFLRAHMDL